MESLMVLRLRQENFIIKSNARLFGEWDVKIWKLAWNFLNSAPQTTNDYFSHSSILEMHMHRLDWSFTGRICDKFYNLICWVIFWILYGIMNIILLEENVERNASSLAFM